MSAKFLCLSVCILSCGVFSLADETTIPEWVPTNEVKGQHYVIRTTAPVEKANALAGLADGIHETYKIIFTRTKEIEPIPINVYRDKIEMLTALGIDALAYEARYKHNLVWSVYQQIDVSLDSQPSVESVLFHEIVHQFVNHVYSLDLEGKEVLRTLLGGLPSGTQRLPVVPRWLNEGLAEFLQANKPDAATGQVDLGRIDRESLVVLQKAIKSGQVRLDDLLLASCSKNSFGGEYYPVAWGLVFYLMHDRNIVEMGKRRKILFDFLATCSNPVRNVLLKDISERLRCLTGEIHWLMVWAPVVEAYNALAFKNIVKHRIGTFEDLENAWKQWILKLDPNDEHGGILNIYQPTVDVSSDLSIVTTECGIPIMGRVIAQSCKGLVMVVNKKEVFIPAEIIQDVAPPDQERNLAAKTYGIEAIEARLRINGFAKKDGLVGRKKPNKDDALPVPRPK